MKPVRYINFNGVLFPENTPLLTVKNRSFKYGDGLFESIRIINGKPCFLSNHMERLKRDMLFLKMNVPSFFTTDFFSEEINRLTHKNDITHGGRARIVIYRNDGGLYSPDESMVSYIIEAQPVAENNYLLNEKGLQVDLFEELKKPLNKLSNLKSNNALYFVMAAIFSKEKGLDDCLILNDASNIAEASGANLFMVAEKKIYTPSLEEGCIAGTMRKQIIKLAGNSGFKVYECALSPADLIEGEELFLTNASSGIRWIAAYKQKRYYQDTALVLLEQLNKSLEITINY